MRECIKYNSIAVWSIAIKSVSICSVGCCSDGFFFQWFRFCFKLRDLAIIAKDSPSRLGYSPLRSAGMGASRLLLEATLRNQHQRRFIADVSNISANFYKKCSWEKSSTCRDSNLPPQPLQADARIELSSNIPSWLSHEKKKLLIQQTS